MEEELKESMSGAFFDSLSRNNQKIRKDRALAISEEAQMRFKRTIEDLEHEKRALIRERAGLLDLSPTNAQSLILATDFNGQDFVNTELDIGVRLRNLEIRLEIAKARYSYLFGAETTNI
jgi:hypothetical protein